FYTPCRGETGVRPRVSPAAQRAAPEFPGCVGSVCALRRGKSLYLPKRAFVSLTLLHAPAAPRFALATRVLLPFPKRISYLKESAYSCSPHTIHAVCIVD